MWWCSYDCHCSIKKLIISFIYYFSMPKFYWNLYFSLPKVYQYIKIISSENCLKSSQYILICLWSHAIALVFAFSKKTRNFFALGQKLISWDIINLIDCWNMLMMGEIKLQTFQGRNADKHFCLEDFEFSLIHSRAFLDW